MTAKTRSQLRREAWRKPFEPKAPHAAAPRSVAETIRADLSPADLCWADQLDKNIGAAKDRIVSAMIEYARRTGVVPALTCGGVVISPARRLNVPLTPPPSPRTMSDPAGHEGAAGGGTLHEARKAVAQAEVDHRTPLRIQLSEYWPYRTVYRWTGQGWMPVGVAAPRRR